LDVADTPKPSKIIAHIQLVGLALVFIFAFQSSLVILNQHWLTMDGSLSHGWIVILLSFFLQLQQVKQLQSLPARHSLIGTLCLVGLSLAWFIAAITNIDLLEQVLLIALLFTVYWSLLGWSIAIRLIPAISLLIFAIPIWDYLIPSLVNLASHVVSQWIEASQIPALIQGNSFFLPYGQVDIAGGCSGVRYLNIALALATYISFSAPLSLTRRLTLLATAVCLALLMNWFRIFSLILIADFSQMNSPLIKNHDNYGWLLFIPVILPLIYIGRRTSNRDTKTVARSSNSAVLKAKYILGTTLALLIGPLLFYTQPSITTPAIEKIDWGLISAKPSTQEHTLNLDNSRLYQSFMATVNAQEIGIDIIKNWQESASDDLIPYSYELYNSDKWSIQQQSQIVVNDKLKSTMLTMEKKPYGQHALLIYWFYIGQYDTHSYTNAKLLQLAAKLRGQNLFTAIGLTTTCLQPDCKKEKEMLLILANQLASNSSLHSLKN
jgi:exosortase